MSGTLDVSGASSPAGERRTVRVDVGDTKSELSHLIARAEAGEDVILARDGTPAARIVPINPPIEDTIALLRAERAMRPRVAADEIRAARDEGRG